MEVAFYKDFAKDIYLLCNLFSSFMMIYRKATQGQAKEAYQNMMETIKKVRMQMPYITSEVTANSIIDSPRFEAYTNEISHLLDSLTNHRKRVFGMSSRIKLSLQPEKLGLSKFFWAEYLNRCDEAIKDIYILITPYVSDINRAKDARYVVEQEDSDSKLMESENIYKLDKIREKLLYLQYTGVIDALRSQHANSNGKTTDARLSKILTHITGERYSYIKNLIGSLRGYVVGRDIDNSVYTKPAIKAAIRCLEEVKVDSQPLFEILMKLEQNKK